MHIAVNLSQLELDYPGLERILAWVASHPQLQFSLDLSGNGLGDYAADLLARCPNLVELNLSNNRITTVGAQALARNTRLTTLDVGGNQIGAAGARALAGNTRLTTLDVGGNQIGDEGAQALAANTTLTTLDVRGNRIGTAGARALAGNTRLTTLDVGGNQIGDEGAQTLREANNRRCINEFKRGMESALKSHAFSFLRARSLFAGRNRSGIYREFKRVRRAIAELEISGFELPQPQLALASFSSWGPASS